MLTLIANFLKNRLQEHRERVQLRDLLQKDDRLLRDVGLTRVDVEAALSKSFEISAKREAYRLSALSLRLDRA
ncbi:MAG: hypothetical protein AB8B85_19510 [Paracoccaceae bacterium]